MSVKVFVPVSESMKTPPPPWLPSCGVRADGGARERVVAVVDVHTATTAVAVVAIVRHVARDAAAEKVFVPSSM